MNNSFRVSMVLLSFISFSTVGQRQMEHLDRGLVAVPSHSGVLLSWRLLGTDPDAISFDVFKVERGGATQKLNHARLQNTTNFLDIGIRTDNDTRYFIQTFLGNVLQEESKHVIAWDKPYLSIPLRTPKGYTANDASVGDLTGDGRYDIVVHFAGRGKDNSQKGHTDEPILHAYTLDGEFLWEINLGKNIREGAHYTQFMVYDLDLEWTFDTNDGKPEHQNYEGQGYHSLTVADVDADGKDEIVFGAMVIDEDGTGLYSSGLGHGDAMHVSDIDPDRPGLELFGIHERPDHPHAVNLRDALTGEVLWSYPSKDVGRGISIDIDPRHKGYESWAFGDGLKGVWNVKGDVISESQPSSSNMAIWWDGDVLRELLDGVNIEKWDFENSVSERIFSGEDFNLIKNNGTKSNPCLSADILGDWREELIARTADNSELRIFSTSIPTSHRIYTLMHNPHYRLSIAWQNVAYNQPPHTDFYFGEGMESPERPGIEVVKDR